MPPTTPTPKNRLRNLKLRMVCKMATTELQMATTELRMVTMELRMVTKMDHRTGMVTTTALQNTSHELVASSTCRIINFSSFRCCADDDVTIIKNYSVKNKIKNLMKFVERRKLINKHYPALCGCACELALCCPLLRLHIHSNNFK